MSAQANNVSCNVTLIFFDITKFPGCMGFLCNFYLHFFSNYAINIKLPISLKNCVYVTRVRDGLYRGAQGSRIHYFFLSPEK